MTIAAYAYSLDAAGNRTGVTDASGASESYTLDQVGRLTSVTYADGTSLGFTYDPAGNRTSLTTAGTTTNYTYDAAGQLTAAGSTDFTYDPAGNRTSAGSTSYTWDDFGNLASATSGATTIAYESNGSGLRVSATSGSTTSTYSWDEAAALPALLSDGTNGYLSADTTLLAETSASANAYPLTDALGSVRAQTDGTGTVTASASYDVYGSVRSSTGSVGSLAYTGALSDSSGLTYLQARELDGSTGTMLSRDPLTPGGPGITGYNPYAYAAQNPTTYTDPSGREVGVAGRTLHYAVNLGNVVWTAARIGLWVAKIVGRITFVLSLIVGVECWLSGSCMPRPDDSPSGGALPIPLQPIAGLISAPFDDVLTAMEVISGLLASDSKPNGCSPDQQGWAKYGDLITLPGWCNKPEAATGVDAVLTLAFTRNGTDISTDPPGYVWLRGDLVHRAHLLAKSLGGRGIRENAIAMHRYANEDLMYPIERDVKAAVQSCQVVAYRVRVIYGGGRELPAAGVEITARGSGGYSFGPSVIPNVPF
jgi:RHS repeat-associated protein